jgi:hypothetical protein
MFLGLSMVVTVTQLNFSRVFVSCVTRVSGNKDELELSQRPLPLSLSALGKPAEAMAAILLRR